MSNEFATARAIRAGTYVMTLVDHRVLPIVVKREQRERTARLWPSSKIQRYVQDLISYRILHYPL